MPPSPPPSSPSPGLISDPDKLIKPNQWQSVLSPHSVAAFPFFFPVNQSWLSDPCGRAADITLITLTKIPLNLEKFWTEPGGGCQLK